MVEAKDIVPPATLEEGGEGASAAAEDLDHEVDSERAVDCSSDDLSSIEENLGRFGGKKRRRSDTGNMNAQENQAVPNESVGDENVLQSVTAPVSAPLLASPPSHEQQVPLPPPPPQPPARPSVGITNWWQKSTKPVSNHALLRGLPACDTRVNEYEFVIENFPSKRSSMKLNEKLYGPIHVVQEYHMRFRLMVFPTGTSEGMRQGGCVSAFIEVLPPEDGTELLSEVDRLISWRYSEVNYYIAALDHADWTKSRCCHDRFPFNDTETDRGWHTFLRHDQLGDYLGQPDNRLVFRYALICQGLQYQTLEGRRRYRGLKNHGTTCYLNSMLQCLFYVGGFRGSVWEMTKGEDRAWLRERRRLKTTATSEEMAEDSARASSDDEAMEEVFVLRPDEFENRSWTEEEIQHVLENPEPPAGPPTEDRIAMPRALQRVFYSLAQGALSFNAVNLPGSIAALSESSTGAETDFGPDAPVQVKDLLKAFGWNHVDQFQQHDAQELNRLLCDRLEERMKGTPAEGSIKRLFGGDSEVYIECTDVEYKSTRTEVFYDLQLQVHHLHTLEESLDEYVREEILEGENCYQAEGHGPQRARKGTRFLRFPPVLQFHLKRFEFDVTRYDMVKINDSFRFPERINFDKWCFGAGWYRLFAVDVHHGEISEGHYYAFVRAPGPSFSHTDTGSDPLADCWWLKFDDESVFRCDERLAIQHNFGGPLEQLVCPYQSTELIAESRANPPLRPYSAYMLFYIREDICRTILTAPNPREVNPGMVYRMNLLERERLKHAAIRREIEGTVKLRLATELSIHQADSSASLPSEINPPTSAVQMGIWRYPSDIPAAITVKRPKEMTVMQLWDEVWRMAENGELGQKYKDLYFPETPNPDGTVVVPGLYYVDMYPGSGPGNQQAKVIQLAQLNGFSDNLCRPDEIGYGIRTWGFIFDDNMSGKSGTNLAGCATLRTNLQYLQGGDPSSAKRATLTVLIHPITLFASHVRALKRGKPEDSSVRKALTWAELHLLHEERTIFPLKIYDPLNESLFSRRLWFVGFCHLCQQAALYEQAQTFGSHENVTSVRSFNIVNFAHDKLMRLWSDPDNCPLNKAIRTASPLFADCIERAAVKYFQQGGVTDQVSRLSGARSTPPWLMFFEYRGMFEQCVRAPEVTRDFRSGCECRAVVAAPSAVLDDPAEAQARREKSREDFDEVEAQYSNYTPTDTHPCDIIKYYDGGREFYAAFESSAARRDCLVKNPALPTLSFDVPLRRPPFRTATANPIQWLTSLRGLRRFRVQLLDIMAHHGRYELVDGRPIRFEERQSTVEPAAMEEADKPESRATTPKNVESMGSTTDGGPITNNPSPEAQSRHLPCVEDHYPVLIDEVVDIDLAWPTGLMMQYLCIGVLGCDPRYLYCYLVPPKESLARITRLAQSHEGTSSRLLSGDIMDDPFPVSLMYDSHDPGNVIPRLYSSMVEQQTKLGLHPIFRAIVGPHPTFDEAPTLSFVASPHVGRSKTRDAKSRTLNIRLFDKRLGMLGCVILDSVQSSRSVEDVVNEVRNAVDKEQLEKRLAMRGDACEAPTTAEEWLAQALQLKECTHRSMREFNGGNMSALTIFHSATPNTVITPQDVRVEPNESFLGAKQFPHEHTKRRGVLECIWVDSESHVSFGYPFTTTVVDDQTVKDVKDTVRAMLTAASPAAESSLEIDFQRSSDRWFKDDSRPVALKDDLVILDDCGGDSQNHTMEWQLLLVTACEQTMKEGSRNGSPRRGEPPYASPQMGPCSNRKRYPASLNIGK